MFALRKVITYLIGVLHAQVPTAPPKFTFRRPKGGVGPGKSGLVHNFTICDVFIHPFLSKIKKKLRNSCLSVDLFYIRVIKKRLIEVI